MSGRSASGRSARRLAEVAREHEARPLARELGLQRPVPELEDRGPRGEGLAGTAAAAAIGGLGHRELQFGLGDLRGDRALDPARVVAREPGGRGLPRHRERRGLGRDLAAGGVAPCPLGAELALRRARKLLHEADAGHRHAFPREAPAIGAAGRHVLDAEEQLRVGQFGERAGHLACRLDHRALGRDLGGTVDGDALRLRKRQRHADLRERRHGGAREQGERGERRCARADARGAPWRPHGDPGQGLELEHLEPPA